MPLLRSQQFCCRTLLRLYSRSSSGIADAIDRQVLSFKSPHMPANGISHGEVDIDGSSLSLESIIKLGRGTKISVSQKTVDRLHRSRAIVDRIVASHVPTYGINTGFGLLSHTSVASTELVALQKNLIRSHASGVGAPLDPIVVRRIMALRINTLARGKSGVSMDTFNGLVNLFNTGCTPEVPSQGTVGASGTIRCSFLILFPVDQ